MNQLTELQLKPFERLNDNPLKLAKPNMFERGPALSRAIFKDKKELTEMTLVFGEKKVSSTYPLVGLETKLTTPTEVEVEISPKTQIRYLI